MALFEIFQQSESDANPLRTRLKQAVIVFGIALALNLAGNGRVSLWDRDEPRYATSVREMKESGDYIVPTFNAEPRYHKPILIYWLMSISTNIFGNNPFGARFVSSLAGAMTCLLCYEFARRLIGLRSSYLAALILLCSPIMIIESKLATTDATLTLFLVGCQFCLWELSKRESKPIAIAFWILLALAFLTKGPIAPAILACAGVATWLCGGTTAYVRRLHWKLGGWLSLAIAGPWYLAVGVLTGGDFYREAIGTHIIKRMTSGLDSHRGIPGYYVFATLASFYPWSAMLPVGLFAAWTRRKGNATLGFLLGWILGPFVLLEMIQTKLIHYYLPCIPACAFLVAWMFEQVEIEDLNLRRWPLGRVSTGLFMGLGIAFAVGSLAGAFTAPVSVAVPAGLIAVLIAGGTFYAFDAIHRGMTMRAVRGLVVSWTVVMFMVGLWLAPAAEPYRISGRAGEKLSSLVARMNLTPVLFEFKEPGAIYAMKRSAHQFYDHAILREMIDSRGAVATLLTPPELKSFADEHHLEIQKIETVEGFNVNKGRTEKLTLSVLRKPKVDSEFVRASQETLVK